MGENYNALHLKKTTIPVVARDMCMRHNEWDWFIWFVLFIWSGSFAIPIN